MSVIKYEHFYNYYLFHLEYDRLFIKYLRIKRSPSFKKNSNFIRNIFIACRYQRI